AREQAGTPGPTPTQAPPPPPVPGPGQGPTSAPPPVVPVPDPTTTTPPPPPPPVDPTVPDVVGQDVGSACAAITAAGLTCAPVDLGDREPGQPANTVVTQDPPGSTQVPAGTGVTVQYFGGCEVVNVPELRGETIDGARARAAAGGFTLSERLVGSPQPPGVVVEQGTPAGRYCSGVAVDVGYDPDAKQEWVVFEGNNGQRVLRTPDNPPSGARGIVGRLGLVMPTTAKGGMVAITSWGCTCGAIGANNRMYVSSHPGDLRYPGPGPTPDAWQQDGAGPVFHLLQDQAPGSVPIYRFERQASGGKVFEYGMVSPGGGWEAVLMGYGFS
ncbi:PASTA domain-containing protein, partial [Angustibacter speluncae]